MDTSNKSLAELYQYAVDTHVEHVALRKSPVQQGNKCQQSINHNILLLSVPCRLWAKVNTLITVWSRTMCFGWNNCAITSGCSEYVAHSLLSLSTRNTAILLPWSDNATFILTDTTKLWYHWYNDELASVMDTLYTKCKQQNSARSSSDNDSSPAKSTILLCLKHCYHF